MERTQSECGGGIEWKAGRRRPTEGGAKRPSHQPRSGALYSRNSRSSGRAHCASPLLCSPNFNSSFLSIHPLLASDQTAPRARHHVHGVKAQHQAGSDQESRLASSNSGLGEQKPTSEKVPRSRGAARKPRQAPEETARARNPSPSRALGGGWLSSISLGRVRGFVSSELRVTSSGICSARGYSSPWA